MMRRVLAQLFATCGVVAGTIPVALAAPSGNAQTLDITVHEGTAMAISLSPDRSTIVMDLQGILFSLPAKGGVARALTDALYDARQPCWYGDGSRIAFQSSRDGHFRIWSIKPDGSDPKVLTPGPFEAREPACSPDGKRIAFSSERSGNYDIWELTLDSGAVRQVTSAPTDETRASYSPDGTAIAYASEREQASGVYATSASGAERLLAKVEIKPGNIAPPIGTPAWTPDGKKIVFGLVTDSVAKLMENDRVISEDEDVHTFRGAWLSGDDYLYTADGKIKRRSLAGGRPTTVEFSATLPITRPDYARRSQDLSSTAPEAAKGLLKPVISPDGKRVAFAALGKLWLMDVGRHRLRLAPDVHQP